MKVLRTVSVRVVLVCGGLIAGIILLEGALQLAALYTWATRPHETHQWLHGAQRVVCLGDSNTYGFFLERPAEQAYPRQMQNRWNEQPDAAPIEVMNLGVPGMNSSKIRSTLPDIIRTLKPDLVFVMVGVNDFWISPVPPEEIEGSQVSFFDFLSSRSRVARLVYMLRRARQQQALDITLPKVGNDAKPEAILHYGGHDIDLTPPPLGSQQKLWRENLKTNLVAIAGLAARANVRLVLLTYPAEGLLYDQANKATRAAAAASGTRLIDLGTRFLELCPSKHCDDLFYFDLHPTSKGHQIAAQMIVDQLEDVSSSTATVADHPN